MPGGPVDQIKARLDIAEVVAERVTLKKAGKSMTGLCPFHVEKTPSFVVFPESGTWHCFGCGAGGDLFTFVMRSQNVDFPEALRLLAARAGVELQTRERERRDAGEEGALHAINEAAAAYFQTMLSGPAGSAVRAYLEKRGVSADSIDTFQLGFAPDSGSGLAHHLLQQGFDRAHLLQAGVVGESESRALYDRFRGRLIFPIRDVAGKLVGFGGRALSPEAQPKYLNTPQTPLFDKGGCLYALDRARQEIRLTGQAVIVEGYMDALIAHQHGFRNVVASLGTSVTERQVSQLKRWAAELCFALDPDLAGQEATARGLSVAMEALERVAEPIPTWKGLVQYVYRLKTAVKIIALPEGLDPDEVIRRDPGQWSRLVQEALPVQDFFLERVRAKHDLATAAGKAAAVEEAMGVIAEIPEPVQQAHYVQRLAALVGMEEAILLQQARRRQKPRRSRLLPATSPAAPGSPAGAGSYGGGGAAPQEGLGIADWESYCLALLLRDPALLKVQPRLGEEHFADPAFREIFRRLSGYVDTGKGDLDAFGVAERLREGLQEALRESLERLLEMHDRHPVHFKEPLEKAYRSAAVTLLLRHLSLRRQQLAALRSEAEAEPESGAGIGDLARIEQQIAREAHRLKLLGGTLPLRAIHKEVRHGG